MTTTTKRKTELMALTVYCSEKKRQVRIEEKDVTWSFGESDCEMCGSHGSLDLSFKCKCGKIHKIDLESW